MKQPKRLLEDAEVLPDPAEGLERNPLRRVSSLPQMMSSQGSGYRSDGGFSNDDASSVGSAPAAAGSLSVPPRKRAYTRRVASPVDEDMDDADYHTRLPPMIDTTSYRDRADLASPLLTSALSPGAGSDNPLSPRDGSTSDDEAIAAARELGSLKIFGTGFGYYEDGASAPPKKSRRGSSSSRRAPARRPPSVDASDGSALPPLPQDWGEDDGDGENGPNGAARAVNRSHYPPVSGRGSEGAFQTTQHMPKGQIRSVLVHGRFKDTAGKDVAHWKCTPLRIDSTADRYDELTAEELETCENLRLLPVQYMHIKDIILSQAYNRTFFRKGDARTWFKMDVTKFGRLYDWFDEELGWFPWSPHPSQSAVESMRDFGLNPKLYNRAALVPPSGGAPARGVGGMVGAAQH
ncbi:hypothetical protein DFJ74DRAFT_419458 [Hyaloraphidium curvatum]|nr:hypothetical protein DFJ74DRAFT_419458 [Hyaloraphidium curvatum]